MEFRKDILICAYPLLFQQSGFTSFIVIFVQGYDEEDGETDEA